ncbi:MAG: acyl carrier protein [Saccharofermentanales bacterium]|jgi:acyl carrier protein
MDIYEEVIAILNEIKPTKDLSEINDIVSGGYIDSFELMSLITLLDEKFDIEIDFNDIVPENFNSADRMAKMVTKLMNRKSM